MARNNIYKESSRTITTQVTAMLTTLSSKSALYQQTESTLIPSAKPMTNVSFGITVDNPYTISAPIEYMLHIKCAFNFNLVMINTDGIETLMTIKGMYLLHGSFDGSFRIETDSTEPVMINLIHA